MPGISAMPVEPHENRGRFVAWIVGELGGDFDRGLAAIWDDPKLAFDTFEQLTGVPVADAAAFIKARFDDLIESGQGSVAAWFLTTYDQCEEAVPYAALFERRDASGLRELTCTHSPDHPRPVNPA